MALAIMPLHTSCFLVILIISTIEPTPSQDASPSVVISRNLPLPRLPINIPVVTRCSCLSLLMIWPKKDNVIGIYDTGEIQTDISRSVFIALPKKPGATEYELHRTISLMSHVTKILLRVVMMRIRSKIKPEIADEQYGFVEGKGTTNAIYKLHTLIQRAIEVQKDVYLCFIDYTKAFDRVRHDEIMKDLTQIKIDGKDLRVIKNIYWEQTAAMRVEGETSTYQKIKRGVRQGWVLSPDLFSLYSEFIMRSIEGLIGIHIGEHIINNLRYADDLTV
ncbi:endonuclease-reverse transcriptase [Elysia marginata]|uniref:Endonuclease-reverse transcriptase n=1 Tax=Elysia marginata TaxID=1093978 RepID=A0AAV4GWB0_9GAST|nr:endonuclease-reverse transcriptase [Elysia marginata]